MSMNWRYAGCPQTGPSQAASAATSALRRAKNLLPASIPAEKLHKEGSGDDSTAATVTAQLSADILPATAVTVPQSESAVVLSKLAFLERPWLRSALTWLQPSLSWQPPRTASVHSSRNKSNSVVRENVIKDSHRQHIAQLESTIEFLNQQVRSKNVVMHGVPDTASQLIWSALSKARWVMLSMARSPPSLNFLTPITHMSRPS